MVQVIPGKNMRCLNENFSGRDAIHAAMQSPGNDIQTIFELILSSPSPPSLTLPPPPSSLPPTKE